MGRPGEKILTNLFVELEKNDCKCRVVSINRLHDLQDEIEHHHERGHISESIYDLLRSYLDFRIPDGIPCARSLITVAVPQSQIEIAFEYHGKSRSVLVPPTYLYYRELWQKLENLLKGILEPGGYHVVRANVPQKLLAVRSGLGLYGRNNICYVPGMGSFHRLVGFYSDLASDDDTWLESAMVEPCEECAACLKACPTGAINEGRFLIRAERCLTFFNENPGDFPEWIDPSWHNCAVGCMLCQAVCPQNREFLRPTKPDQQFSDEETTLILEGAPVGDLSAPTVKKLEQSDLVDYLEVLPRNLRVLLA